MAIAQLVLDIFVPQMQKRSENYICGKTVLKSTLVEKQNKEQRLSISWSNCFKNPDI